MRIGNRLPLASSTGFLFFLVGAGVPDVCRLLDFTLLAS
jgi:hypothetical protein